MELKDKIIISLLVMMGFLGGWLHTVIGFSADHGMDFGAVAGASLSAACFSATVCALAVGGWSWVGGDGILRAMNSRIPGELSAVGLSFAAGSLGLRAALWATGA